VPIVPPDHANECVTCRSAGPPSVPALITSVSARDPFANDSDPPIILRVPAATMLSADTVAPLTDADRSVPEPRL
jgi:hypothetical protein